MAAVIVQFHQHFQLINFSRRYKCIWVYFWHTPSVVSSSCVGCWMMVVITEDWAKAQEEAAMGTQPAKAVVLAMIIIMCFSFICGVVVFVLIPKERGLWLSESGCRFSACCDLYLWSFFLWVVAGSRVGSWMTGRSDKWCYKLNVTTGKDEINVSP